MPEEFFDFAFHDEAQCDECLEQLMLPHCLSSGGMIIRFQDALQTPPHEATRLRGTTFGDLRKQFYGGVLGLPVRTSCGNTCVVAKMA